MNAAALLPSTCHMHPNGILEVMAKVSPHEMLPSLATALVEQGRSPHEIGTILGHENPATTAIYGWVKA
ncbi:tyrosine-type recombinase/integrase [Deinococcus marmoris]|uniref:Tyr recombinase domain-containing protein n=1 Tax=Deinococcus marmoris TaxID=249408 RepID=A0A1U7NS12_9DEIO|nr:tyrosine-type recombinase/integrase [Deinococcus marmoris]OLV15697.1 hypothetical protein BOO71_0014131 [Deinococcus marmoris]